jgi:hypothetical protein
LKGKAVAKFSVATKCSEAMKSIAVANFFVVAKSIELPRLDIVAALNLATDANYNEVAKFTVNAKCTSVAVAKFSVGTKYNAFA